MPLIELPSAKVNIDIEGEGPTLVLLHASPGDSRDFDAVTPALAERFRVITVDWPGFGESPLPSAPDTLGVPFFYQVFCELMEALKLGPVTLLGNSLGGNVAALYAIQKPHAVRALVLVSPGGFTPHNLLTRNFCRMMGSRLAIPPMIFARLYLKRDTPYTREMKMRAEYEQSTPGVRALIRSIWRSFLAPEYDLRQCAADITQPTLLMFGKHDPVIPANKDGQVAASLISAATFEIMDCGHAPFAEIPEEFLARLMPFLARLTLH